MNEPKYQLSQFLGPDRNRQVVVRSDELDEFKKMIEDINELFPSSAPSQEASKPAEPVREPVDQPEGEIKMCLLHDEPMVQKYSQRKQTYYFEHRNEAGKPCFGQGYKS